MSQKMTAVELTQALLRFETVNPPGDELACAQFIGKMLESGGFQVKYYEFDHNRTSLIASIDGAKNVPPLCFTGHIDVVPLGKSDWSKSPFRGEIESGKLYGRGSSDMKSGVAAMVLAAMDLARRPALQAGIKLVITAGEERCCQGANYLASLPNVLGETGAIVVGEPTSNVPLLGHKGVLWFEAIAKGKTAHGSMPEKGENAIYKVARAISGLIDFDFAEKHELMGKATLNVGTMFGGENINSVPDYAQFTIDIRSIPGQDHEAIRAGLQQKFGDDVNLLTLHSGSAIYTEPENRWVQSVFDVMEKITGQRAQPAVAPYFTDGSALKNAMGNPPALILGPGELSQAHKTDEFCFVENIDQAYEAYLQIGENWVVHTS
ncbi:MAG: M20 family metallopeptidase [Deferribacteres bacterium]|nr:M20 family metallopeptidase [candidate division KSB1 bacterium]MCB9510515.1 M20 family metallopeptidase [Deferribacteres bacterium]